MLYLGAYVDNKLTWIYLKRIYIIKNKKINAISFVKIALCKIIKQFTDTHVNTYISKG